MYPIELETERQRIHEYTPSDVEAVLRDSTERTGIFFQEMRTRLSRKTKSSDGSTSCSVSRGANAASASVRR